MGRLDGGRLLGPTRLHGLQLARVRHLEAGLVLGQDLHEGPQLQPPLLLGDPVPVGGGGAAEQGLGPPPSRPPSRSLPQGPVHLHEVRLLLQLGHGLEEQVSFAYSQHTDGIVTYKSFSYKTEK